MSLLQYGLFLTAPPVFISRVQQSRKYSSTGKFPGCAVKPLHRRRNPVFFSLSGVMGGVISNRSGADIDCPPEKDGVSICAVFGNTQILSFSLHNEVVLQFVSGDLWETRGYPPPGGTLLHLCQTQAQSETLFYDGLLGYCDQDSEGIVSFTSLMQHPWQQEENKESVMQLSFFPLEQEKKFAGLTVYKTLPVSEECKKALVNESSLTSEEARLCVQESTRLFAEAESTQEGEEFHAFLKGLRAAK